MITDLLTRGGRRVHAFVTLLACVTLCVALLLLCGAAFKGRQVQVEIASVTTGLSGLVGWVYRTGKQAGVEAPVAPVGCAISPNPGGQVEAGSANHA